MNRAKRIALGGLISLGMAVVVGALAAHSAIRTAGGASALAHAAVARAAGPVHSAAAADAHTSIVANYLKIPLSFERNDGQTDSRVKYLARGPGYEMFLTPAEAVLALRKPDNLSPKSPLHEWRGDGGGSGGEVSQVLRMTLVGANRNPQIEGAGKLPGKANYLIGNDPKSWHAAVPMFAQVKYDGVYPGIDLVYHGSNQRQLEYDFRVAPGADPRKIELGFAGAKKLTIDAGGNLIVHVADSELVERVPVVYQEIGGKRRPVAGAYALHGADRVGFAIAAYNRAQPLIIDPVLTYATYLGGSIFDYGTGVAADAAGSAYVTGYTASFDFPTTAGAFKTVEPNKVDAFVSKLNPAGTGLVYSTYLGGSDGKTEGMGIAIDSASSAYVTGFTWAGNFPTKDAFQPFIGRRFFAKTPPASTRRRRHHSDAVASQFGAVRDQAVAARGEKRRGKKDSRLASVAGKSQPAVFPPDTPQRDFPGSGSSGGFVGHEDAFVTKLTPDGSGLVYSTFLGGYNHDRGYAIAVNASGNAYVTGYTKSPNFPITPGAFQKRLDATGFGCFFTGACQNAFVTELTADGSNLIYSTYLGGNSDNSDDIGSGIAVDPAGNAYVTGSTDSISNASCLGFFNPRICCSGLGTGGCIGFPTTPGAYQTELTPGAEDNVFVTKLNPLGTGLVYSTLLGGDSVDLGHAIAIDGSGDAYVAGKTESPDFPITPGSFEPTPPGSCQSGFMSEFNSTGSALDYSTYIGSTAGCDKYSSSIAVDPVGDVYVGGRDDDASFPITTNAACTSAGAPFVCCTGSGTGTCSTIQGTFGGDRDGYLMEFQVVPATPPLGVAFSTFAGGAGFDQTTGVAIDPSGNAYLAGFTSSTNFPTTASALQTNLKGTDNAFVEKIACLPKGTATIFAGNYNQTVTVYPAGSNCNAAPTGPLGTGGPIVGAATGIYFPFGLAYSTLNKNLYAVNYGGASITVYSQAEYDTGGNVAPIATIRGPKTGLTGALGIAVNNANGNIYVANSAGGSTFAGSITVYSVGSTNNAAPVQTITGSATGLSSPQGVAIDPATGNIWVANLEGPAGSNGAGAITEYAANANGNATPIVTIAGLATGLSQPSGISLDLSGDVYVANNDGGPSASGAVTIYTPTDITATPPNASGWRDVTPKAEIEGPQSGTNYTLLNAINGIAVDANGLIYVANFGATGSVTVYPSLAALPGQLNYPNVSPLADITGPATLLYAPRGIAVDPPPAMTRRARRRRHKRR